MTQEIENPSYEISKFKFIQILSNNTNRKMIAVLGSFPHISESDKAVVLLEKSAFTEKDVSSGNGNNYFSEKLDTKIEFINNVYGSFQCFPPANLNGVKATVIFPASDKHIQKYSPHEKFIIEETPALYENITKPYLKSGQFSLDWIYNILEHKQEEDRIIYEDNDPENGFILLPDLKWDGRAVETLYILAITHKRNIKSIRDLNETHLSLLENIRDSGCAVIENKFGLKKSQLRIYFHYQPSFYHLHVHFNALRNEFPGVYCEKSHLLDTVINNIKLLPDYYKKSTIPFAIYDGDHLLDKFQEENVIVKKVRLNNDYNEENVAKKEKLNDDNEENVAAKKVQLDE